MSVTATIALAALSMTPAHAMNGGEFKGEALLAAPTAQVVEAKGRGPMGART